MKEKEAWLVRLDEQIRKLEERLAELETFIPIPEETAAPISTKRRNDLPDDVFAVPGKRKLPLDTCMRVRNAMSRFAQTQGLTPAERRTAYNKILRAAKKCNIDATGFKNTYGK